MPKIDLDSIPQTNATGYPPPFDEPVAGRWYRRLAPVAGLTLVGASHVVLKPGAWSSQRHWHRDEDELVVMLSGRSGADRGRRRDDHAAQATSSAGRPVQPTGTIWSTAPTRIACSWRSAPGRRTGPANIPISTWCSQRTDTSKRTAGRIRRADCADLANVIIPIPARDFDPTEVAVSWRVLTRQGHEVRFATADGRRAAADGIMLDGIGLDPWGEVPGLRRVRVFGALLRANRDAREALCGDDGRSAFPAPLRWDEVSETAFDGLLLPGGHRARGMRAYLESAVSAAARGGILCRGPAGGGDLSRRAAGGAEPAGGWPVGVVRRARTTALTWRQEKAADGAGARRALVG